MAKNKIYSAIMILLLSLMAVALPVSAQTTGTSTDPVVTFLKINGDEISQTSSTVLELDRGESLDIRIGLKAVSTAFIDGFVEATIVGYEHGFLRDEKGPFDVDVGEEKRFSLNIELPTDMDRDRYDLRVLVFDRRGAVKEFRFPLDIDTARHTIEIKDVAFNPGSVVESGRSLLTTVRLENRGEQDEEVRVNIEIPGVGQATDFIDEIDEDETVTSEELFVRIPRCAEKGTYNAKITVSFNDDKDSVTAIKPIEIVDGGLCEETLEARENEAFEKTSIAIGSTGTERADNGRATFPVTITNDGSKTTSYSLTAEGADQWASIEIAPSNVMSLRSGETATAFLYVMPKKGISGEQVMTLKVASGGKTLENIPLKVVAAEQKSNAAKILTVILIIIIVVVIIVALIVAFRKTGGNEDKEDEDLDKAEEGTTYY